jgi:hypothetical protein
MESECCANAVKSRDKSATKREAAITKTISNYIRANERDVDTCD